MNAMILAGKGLSWWIFGPCIAAIVVIFVAKIFGKKK